MAARARAQESATSRTTSVRARWCLALLVAGFFLFTVIAGAAHSPLTTPLPAGAHQPGWTAALAGWFGIRHASRLVLTAASLLLVAGLLAAFGLLLAEAWANRVRLSPVLVAAGISLALTTAAPLLLSRDVFSYAMYGRIFALYHHNPYVVVPAAFPGDRFLVVTSAQWHHTRSLYGPLFTLASGAIVRVWLGSPNATILAFKVLVGAGVGIATICSALAALSIRPARAALAAAIVGLNPVLVIHTVGGGHVDGMIAALLAAALALAMTVARRELKPMGLRAVGETVLLTLACLIKILMLPALVLWLWWLFRAAPQARRVPSLLAHLAVVAILSIGLFAPFLAGFHTFTPVVTLGGVESWASPTRLVARAAQALVETMGGANAGRTASHVVVAVAILILAVLWWRIARRLVSSIPRQHPEAGQALATAWGSALLLLALGWPYLLPWYAAWFVPYLGLMEDVGLAWTGVAAAGLLAFTIIPADPARGLSASGVMIGAHYVVAPLMLLLFVLAAARVWRSNGMFMQKSK
jgi:hypothetical protein